MKSFKEYANEDCAEEKETATAEELAKKISSAYNGRSNADMLRSILAEAERSKRAGTLSNEEIEKFYRNFAPMLDATQKRCLRAIVDKLKAIE